MSEATPVAGPDSAIPMTVPAADGLVDPEAPDTGGLPLGVPIALGLAAGAILLAVRRARRRARRRLLGRWRVEAERELDALGNARFGDLPEGEAAGWLARASELARRIALVGAPREEIAVLEGEAWLARLDVLAGERVFSDGPGRKLASGPYQRAPSFAPAERAALLDALRQLVAAVDESDDAPAARGDRLS